MDCCDVNGLNRTFRARTARADRRHYLRRGLDDRQRALLDFPLDNVSHLDIGCGIGALGLTGLNGGMTSSYFVDVSEAYLDTARQLATETGVEERASFLQGDAAHLELPEVDLVTLDRVVCCYPDARGLLSAAAHASRRYLTFSYPSDRWWLRALFRVGNGFLRLTRREYRAFNHPEAELHAAAASAGHSLTSAQKFGMWRVVTFERSLA